MNQIIGFKDFQVGQRLNIKGRQSEDGVFVAEAISIRAPADQAVLRCLVWNIDHQRNALRVLNREFILPDCVEIRDLQNNVIFLKDLKRREMVEISGKYSELTGLTLERIKLQEIFDSDIEQMQGDIRGVDQEKKTLDVNGFVVAVDENATAVSVDSTLAYSPLYKAYFESIGENQYYLSPQLKSHWGGPFNGQMHRQQLFCDLIQKISFAAIVETGTFRGTTTEYMNNISPAPIYTVELHPQYYGFAKARLHGNNKITVCQNDSRIFLKQLPNNPDLIGKQIFFYLDAHWGEDLPLLEEVEIIFRTWPRSVLMIDDFKVPGDAGYGYDNYGPGKALTLEYLGPLDHLKFTAFFPSQRSESETGQKRGCVVLARAPDLIGKLIGLDGLALHSDERL